MVGAITTFVQSSDDDMGVLDPAKIDFFRDTRPDSSFNSCLAVAGEEAHAVPTRKQAKQVSDERGVDIIVSFGLSFSFRFFCHVAVLAAACLFSSIHNGPKRGISNNDTRLLR